MTANPNVLKIKIHDSVDEAPHWNRDHADVRLVDIESAHIVCGGMASGKSSVDIEIVDLEGNRFVGILTGDLIKGLAKAIEGAENRVG